MDWQPVAEEYKAVYENYKVTFDHAANLAKFYSGISMLILAGLSSKVFSDGIGKLTPFREWILVILCLLVLLGLLSVVVMARITMAREGCIRRMNFLRRSLLEGIEGFNYQEYEEICGFKEPNLKQNWSVISHSAFIIFIIIFVLSAIMWVVNW